MKLLKSFLLVLLMCAGLAFGAESIKNVSPASMKKISKIEVFWMYTMKTRFWDDGTRITVFYLDFDNKVHKDFCLEVLGVTTTHFEQSVNAYINHGNASYFRKVSNESELISQVARTPGSIGYVSSEFMMLNRNGNVEKIRITN